MIRKRYAGNSEAEDPFLCTGNSCRGQMAEAGVDISGQKSEHIDVFKDVSLDYVITICGHANEHCPVFGGKTKVIHIGFDDPPKLAKIVFN